jgi:predicted N-acetyltransferase YhbS
MNDIAIRAYTDRDLIALAALTTELGYPTSTEEMSQRMARIKPRDDFATFVAEAAGHVVGMIGVCMRPSYEHNVLSGQILALAVSESARKRGVGARLVKEAEAWLASRKAARVVVNSAARRADAHAFYARLGYRETGRRFVKFLRDEG